MFGKRLILASAIVGVLALGMFTAGAVMAQEATEEGDTSTSAIQSFASRVAGILGLQEQQVQDAFEQARREMADEAIQQRLSRMVESGVITQEQADELLEWYQSRPEILQDHFFFPGFGGHGHHGHRMFIIPGGGHGSLEFNFRRGPGELGSGTFKIVPPVPAPTSLAPATTDNSV